MKINLYLLPRKFLKDKLKLRNIAKAVLAAEGKRLKELNIVFTDDKQMQKLNNNFFKKNYPTDIMSFLLESDYGEIYISKNQIVGYRHMLELIIHGLLHLCGFDHRTAKDKKVMAKKTLFYSLRFE